MLVHQLGMKILGNLNIVNGAGKVVDALEDR